MIDFNTWDLYLGEETEDVTKLLDVTFKEVTENIATDIYKGDTLFVAVIKAKEKMVTVMEMNRNYGANDSEPRMLFAQRLIEFIKKRFDITPDKNLYNIIRY